MTVRGFSRSSRRSVGKVTRYALRALGVVLAVPLWLFWLVMILLQPFGRVFIQVPLAVATLAGVGAALYFSMHHVWDHALSAAAFGAVSGIVLAAYTALAERVDPDFSRPSPWPPWWWYL